MTAIQWTEETWNPTTGCNQVSPGCDNCYALTMAKRLKGMGSAKYQTDGDPRTSGPGFGFAAHHDALDIPLRWKKPRKVFVNSMSDLFHDSLYQSFIEDVFATMALTPQHTYQILTKRHARLRSVLSNEETFAGVCEKVAFSDHQFSTRPVRWPLPNVHIGVTVEDQKWADIRIPYLLDTPASVRFLSCEPLLGPVNLTEHLKLRPVQKPGETTFTGLEWVIVGGESGPGSRPMPLWWVRRIVEQCRDAGVAVFVKQLGSVWAADTYIGGRAVGGKGGDPNTWPADLRVREFPEDVTA